jgi:outer membrane receptor protein involved in Fe transport
LPQYANDRFKDDYTAPAIEAREVTMSTGAVFHVTPWLSPYINYAQTFNAPRPLQRLDTSFLPATVAEGYDVGLRFSLLKRRLNVNVLYYRNEEINNAFGPNITGQVNALLNANPIGDTSVAGRNRRGLENIPGASDLRDREADGFEFEVIANVAKGWRLMLNVGLPKVYDVNAYQDTKKYIDGNAATFRLIAQDAGVIIDANNQAAIDESIPVDQRSLDVFAARDGYNAIFSLRRNFVDRKRLIQDQPNGNFFSDYTIQSGKLRGLRVGAGVQYRGRQIIGFRGADSIVNPAGPTRAIDDPTVDAYSPAFTPESYHTVTATLGYTWRLERNREIQFNLRINNVLDDRGPIYAASPVMRPPAGDVSSPARVTVANNFVFKEPISFNLTTTLKF